MAVEVLPLAGADLGDQVGQLGVLVGQAEEPPEVGPGRRDRVARPARPVERAAGAVEDVRLILLDTPESVDPSRPDECFGAEATAFTAWLFSLAPDGEVWLEKDVSERDRFGRLLRYAWLDLGDGARLATTCLTHVCSRTWQNDGAGQVESRIQGY